MQKPLNANTRQKLETLEGFILLCWKKSLMLTNVITRYVGFLFSLLV